MSLIQGRRMSDYDMGWHLFRFGDPLPACASRPMVDGWNNARRAALAHNRSMMMAAMVKGATDREKAIKALRALSEKAFAELAYDHLKSEYRREERKHEPYHEPKDTRKRAFAPHKVRHEKGARMDAMLRAMDRMRGYQTGE